jgi:anti-anti-sigma factor
MDITITESGSQVRMKISGHIDEAGAAEMKRRFQTLDLSHVTEAVFNLHDVGYIGSAGLGKLLLFYKKLSMHNAVMKIEHPSEMIREVLIELRLDALFAIA